MSEFYLSSGKAARALGVNADVIRRLCEAEAIRSEVTPGGQWRVPAEEIKRLKRDGLPPVPKPLPGCARHRPDTGPAPEVSDPHETLLADPSEEAIAAADEVVRLENEVRALGLKRRRQEALDWFSDRQKEAGAQAAEEKELEAAREAEEWERSRRQRLQDRWLEYALARIPWEAQGHVEAQLHSKVKAVLANVDTAESDVVIERLVDGVVAAVLRPFHRRAEIARLIEEAVDAIPYGAKAWEERAREAARVAVERLGPEASMNSVQNAAANAVKSVMAQYTAAKEAEADAAERERLVRWLPLELGRAYSESGVELALKAVKDAWAKLPVGTPRAKLEAARDAALQPFRQAIANREAAVRAEALAHQKRQLEAMQALFRTPAHTIPHRPPIIRRSPTSR